MFVEDVQFGNNVLFGLLPQDFENILTLTRLSGSVTSANDSLFFSDSLYHFGVYKERVLLH